MYDDSRNGRIYYAQIRILTHRLEIRASSWRTHILKAIEIADGHLAHQRNKIGKVQNAEFCLPNQIPVRDADWFKYHFRQLYFKADWSEIHFLFTLSFPFYAFVFTSAENMLLLLSLPFLRQLLLYLFPSLMRCVQSIGATSKETEAVPWLFRQKRNRKNGDYNWLSGYLREAKFTVELWESDIRTGSFCDRD